MLRFKIQKSFSKNYFDKNLKTININNHSCKLYSVESLQDPRVEDLPYSIRVLLESAMRNCDDFSVKQQDIENILNWKENSKKSIDIPFKPARVLLQDFTGVPAVVDLAAMRDATKRLGGDPMKINPLVPVDLVIDHSVQADVSRSLDAVEQNEEIEFKRNYERFEFLKWGSKAFQNFNIVPPGSGIVHQVNLEYLARVVFNDKGLLYNDSVVGTDSHTTMVNGLGVLGWGVGGLEAESVMLGQTISMVLPEVIGFKMTGELRQHVTATDLVLTCTQMLRKLGVVGKFVEFYGEGLNSLTLADRATISNMGPEYGATVGYFPVDEQTLNYLRLTGRDKQRIDEIEYYSKEQNFFLGKNMKAPTYTKELHLDLSTVDPCISGPKRPHDRVTVSNQPQEFKEVLTNPVGFKGFGIKKEQLAKMTTDFEYKGNTYTLKNGSIVIAAITSCTNTSNPDSLIAAGMIAKNAIKKGLKMSPYIKTILAPGSGVVTKYFSQSDLQESLNQLGFTTTGYGCMACIGNSGEIEPEVEEAIKRNDVVATSVLSGNRNFEGRIHPLTRANYLASPALVVCYALAGNIGINFDKEPIQINDKGEKIYLKDIWPTRDEVKAVVKDSVTDKQFKEIYSSLQTANKRWNNLMVEEGLNYQWNEKSTYIHNPPFFSSTELTPKPISNIENAYCLLNLGDSITTDHISPAGAISVTSTTAKFLNSKGVEKNDFNTYGARRGNDEIMARGTFANVRLVNKLVDKVGPFTIHWPSGKEMQIFDAAMEYKDNNKQTIVLAGQEYGSGSSRDWAAKGPYLQGIKAVIAQSYERIHRSNLIGMGILPLQFKENESADSLKLNGQEQFTIDLKGGNIGVGETLQVRANDQVFEVKARIDTEPEIQYFKHGGILQYVLRNLNKNA